MDIAGTKKKIQRVTKVAEETYKKMNEMLERMGTLQEDVEETSEQVDRIEHDLAKQQALLRALAEEQDLDVEAIIEDADLPDLGPDDDDEETTQATSRPSADES
jgi:methyl-accepting chemotaxis protein